MTLIKIILSILFIFFVQSCVALSGQKKSELDELQLQDEIQRFYSRFTERTVEGILRHRSPIAGQKMVILNEYTLYDSEALKIATSPYPGTNLLDMLVFIKLNKGVIQRYWVPEVYGEEGLKLFKAFQDSEDDIDSIALKVLTEDQLATINRGVRKWLAENPNAIRVEKVRLADFSKYAHHDDGGGISFSISQIFVDTKSTVKAVDQAILVGNRALFLTQHLPFIIRLQARLSTQEIIQDTITNFQSAPLISEGMSTMPPLIHNLTTLTREAHKVMADLHELKPLLMKNDYPREFNSLLDKSIFLVDKFQITKPKEYINYIAGAVIVVFAAISLLWWGGYYIAKRMLNHTKKEVL